MAKTRCGRVGSVAGGLLAGLLFVLGCAARGQTSATTVPLLLPAGLVYDAAGDLLFSEAGRHVVRSVSPTGVLTTIAGTGVQGVGGDGGLATAAMLDTPGALALDTAGDLFIADVHNRCVRRVDASSGVITTVLSGVTAAALAVDAQGRLVFAEGRMHQVRRLDLGTGSVSLLAGSGVQGFSGDGGAATAAALDTPAGLALDAAGNVFLADAHNHRVRRVDAVTGVISTLTQSLAPRGMVVDEAGNVVFADRLLNEVVRVSAGGTVSVVAGTGREAYAGDGGAAVSAALDAPGGVGLAPGGLVTLTDAANGRVRQVDGAAVIHTIAGLGATVGSTLTLAGPAVMQYGSTGTPVVATLATSAAVGTVTFFDAGTQATPVTLGSVTLVGNAATLATGGLQAGMHRLSAAYSGDGGHGSAASASLGLTVAPAPAVATPNAATMLYGSTPPVLTGTLTGILARDTVNLTLRSGASATAAPANYAISGTLTGAGAGNYVLTTVPAALTVVQAPVVVTLSQTLAVGAASTTTGTPSGSVTLLDGATVYGTQTLVAGAANFSSGGLAAGSHTLTARYGGDVDFTGGVSTPTLVSVGPSTLPDFALAVNGATAVTVPAGSAAQYSFAVTPSNGSLSSPLVLAATGLPPNATASFNPAYLPPSGAPSAFILTVQTPKAALPGRRLPYAWALLLPLLLWRRRRVLGLGLLVLLAGCGDRVNHSADTVAVKSYTVTVSATTTQNTGATLQHTANVTLNVQ